MKIVEGLSAFSGIAMGPVHLKKKLRFPIPRIPLRGLKRKKDGEKKPF